MTPPSARRPLHLLLTALAASALLLVAGCGGDGASATATATTATSAPTGATAVSGTSSTPAPGATSGAEPVASTAATPTSRLPHAIFVSGQTRIELPIEVPTEKEYGIGLSGRRELVGRGMLFSFPEGANVGFWMKGTHIDLDIAFVDASMKVIDIKTMRADTLDIHKPSGPYVAAIEAPAGWYAASGIATGAQVTLTVDLKAATGR